MAVKISNKELKYIFLRVNNVDYAQAQRLCDITDYEITVLTVKLNREIAERKKADEAYEEQQEFIKKNKERLKLKLKK